MSHDERDEPTKPQKRPTQGGLFAEPKVPWSSQQEAVFRNICRGAGHTLVRARAGSGKSTTIIEACKRIPNERILILAFGRKDRERLEAKAPPHVSVMTTNAYGLSVLKHALERKDVPIITKKTQDILYQRLRKRETETALAVLPPERGGRLDLEEQTALDKHIQELAISAKSEWSTLAEVVRFAKSSLAFTEEEVLQVIFTYKLDVDRARRKTTATVVAALLQEMLGMTAAIELDEQIWLPVALGLVGRRYDRVFVDETQDLTPAQIALALSAVTDGGRMCVVGDDRQAIYAWRGADTRAMAKIEERLQPTEFPLSVSYRCDRAIIAVAQQEVPDIVEGPGAGEGTLAIVDRGTLLDQAAAGDFVLSRVNAPLVGLCLSYLRQHKPATIVGKDFGKGLVKRFERFAKKAKSIPRMLEDIQEWTREETARRLRQDPDTDVETVADEGTCMVTVCQTAKTPEEAIKLAKNLFVETPLPKQIALATTHAAKGDERKRVWVLADTYRRRDTLEEHNLWYVAVTRAMHTLYLVSDGTFNDGNAATSTWLRLPPEYA